MALEASYNQEQKDRKDLSISNQNLTSLPVGLAGRVCKELITHLDISGNNLSSPLPELAQMTGLHSLNISRNGLDEFPIEICRLVGLKVLIVKHNNIKSLPEDVASLERLEELNLSGNDIHHFPPSVLSLRQLISLHLGANKLSSIPSDINQLKELLYLYLGGNRLQQVPYELGHMSKLECLNLSANQLQYIPQSFKELTSLKSLHLHSNRLQTLPQDIVYLRNLQELSLRNNPLVLRFIRDWMGVVPSLLELSGQAVKYHTISYDNTTLPETLCDFLSRARHCDNPSCSGVYFTSRNRRVTFVDFCGKYRIPLMQYLCSDRCYGNECTNCQYSSSSEDENDEVSQDKIRKVLLG